MSNSGQPSPSDAVPVGIAIVVRDGHALVRRRPDRPGSPMPGVWEFPGGKCEPGEPPDRAAVRECLEESGLDVGVVRERASFVHDYAHGRIHLHYYECSTRDPGAEPTPDSGYRWSPIGELPRLTFPPANDGVVRGLVADYAES